MSDGFGYVTQKTVEFIGSLKGFVGIYIALTHAAAFALGVLLGWILL